MGQPRRTLLPSRPRRSGLRAFVVSDAPEAASSLAYGAPDIARLVAEMLRYYFLAVEGELVPARFAPHPPDIHQGTDIHALIVHISDGQLT